MNLLNKFHADFQVKGAVKEFLLEHLQKLAVKRAFAGEETTGIKEAKQIIESAFKDLDKTYSEKKKRTPRSYN